MSRQHPPDRLAAILAELDEGRRTPWLPVEDELIDRRPIFGLRRARRRDREQGLAALGFSDDLHDRRDDDFDDHYDDHFDGASQEELDAPGEVEESSSHRQPHSRAERRSRGERSAPALRPHTPLFRSPLPDTDIESKPGRSALIGALVVLVVVAIVFGFRVWAARQQATPTPLSVPASSTRSPDPTSKAAGSGEPRGGSNPTGASSVRTGHPSGSVLVHVVGQVRKPGVVRLPAGSRVDDAIKAAGGATPAADLAAVNLARPVGDGEQVHVPKPGETPSPVPNAITGGSGAATGGGAPAGGAAAGPVDLNTATEADLDGLPGVGPVLASRILQWRTTNGRFTSVDDLGEVSGIGDKLLEQLRPLVTV